MTGWGGRRFVGGYSVILVIWVEVDGGGAGEGMVGGEGEGGGVILRKSGKIKLQAPTIDDNQVS